MAERAPGFLKSRWFTSIVSLLIGLGLGTTLGDKVLDSTGVPASCVRTIQRAETALANAETIAENGREAFDAVTDVRIGDAVELLTTAADDAQLLLDQVAEFNDSRKECQADRS